MLENLKKTHPRLMVDDFEQIKLNIKNIKFLQNMYKSVHSDCKDILAMPQRQGTVQDIVALRIESVKLAFAYKIEGDIRYKERLFDNITIGIVHLFKNVIAPSKVTPILHVSAMAGVMAIAYDWLYDDWSDEQRLKIRQLLKELVLDYYERDLKLFEKGNLTERDILWTYDYNNVQHTGVKGGVLASLALGDEYEKQCEYIMDMLLNRVYNLDLFRPNGVYPEGVSYWTLTIHDIVLVLSSLETALGTDFGLSDKKGLSETGWFSIMSTGPADGNQLKFADANPVVDRRVHSVPAMMWMGSRYNRPEYIWWEKYVVERADFFRNANRVMDIIWYNPEKDIYADEKPEFPLLNILEGDCNPLQKDIEAFASVVTIRDKWYDKNSAWVGLKTGGNPTHHGQLDVGTFMISLKNVDFLNDLGWEIYTKAGQFEGMGGNTGGQTPWHKNSPRWLYYRNRAEGHNTLVLNPGEDVTDQNVPCFAPIVCGKNSDEYGYVVTDMTSVYNGVSKIFRGIKLLHNQNKIIVQDEISGDKVNDIYWFAHTRAELEIINSTTAKMTKDGETVYAILKTKSGSGKWKILPAARFLKSPKPLEEDSANEGVKKLCVNIKEKNDIISVMFTADFGEHWITEIKEW